MEAPGTLQMRNAEVQRGGWQPGLIKAETTVESAKHRKAAVLTTDYRMNADRGPSKCGMGNGELIPPSSRRCALPQSPPGAPKAFGAGEGGPRGCCARPLLGIAKCTKSWTDEAAAERP
jgi:hypothetical protein